MAYAIGVAHPVSVSVETYGTETRPVDDIDKPGSTRTSTCGPARHRREPRPAPADLPEDRRLRPLRPPRPGLHLGEHGHRPGGRRNARRLGLAGEGGGDGEHRSTTARPAGSEPAADGQVFPLVEARSLDRILDYAVPPALEGAAQPGAMVVCPLGPRRVLGVVVGRDAPSHEGRLVPIAGVVEGRPVPAELLELAAWMARYYMAPVAACLRLVLPPGGGGALRRDASGEWILAPPPGRPAGAPDGPPQRASGDGLTPAAVRWRRARGRRRAARRGRALSPGGHHDADPAGDGRRRDHHARARARGRRLARRRRGGRPRPRTARPSSRPTRRGRSRTSSS